MCDCEKNQSNIVYMKLYDEPFELIKSNKKTIEVRCNDEKRRQLNVGDKIVFCRYDNPDEQIYTEIVGLQALPTFEKLYNAFPMENFGNKDASVEDMLVVVDRIYSKEQQEKYGALAICIKVDTSEKKSNFFTRLFKLKKHKVNPTVERIYYNTNIEQREKIFYGDMRSAERILILLSKSTFNYVDDVSIEQSFQIYLQVWIRARGGFNPTFRTPSYIKEALCKRFNSIKPDTVIKCVNCALSEIYCHEPKLKSTAEAIETMQASVSNNAKKNAEIENKFINDADYGLIPEKPIFVNGFGSDRNYLSHLYTEDGIKLNFDRVGSTVVTGISGPVDLYRLLLPDGKDYLQIFICNYGSSSPKRRRKVLNIWIELLFTNFTISRRLYNADKITFLSFITWTYALKMQVLRK